MQFLAATSGILPCLLLHTLSEKNVTLNCLVVLYLEPLLYTYFAKNVNFCFPPCALYVNFTGKGNEISLNLLNLNIQHYYQSDMNKRQYREFVGTLTSLDF